MSSNTFYSHERDVANLERMLEAVGRPPKKQIGARLQSNIDNAIAMSIRDNKEYVVVDIGGQNYQIWPKSIVDKYGHKCVYTTGESQCG